MVTTTTALRIPLQVGICTVEEGKVNQRTRVGESPRMPVIFRPDFLVLAAGLLMAASANSEPASAVTEPTPAESLFKPVGMSRELGVPEPLPPPFASDASASPRDPAKFDVLP